ncbi:MAG: tRNA guanosine(34) transglycosylase Tgt [Candidatus Aminicenantes bacterium]|nr:tRNA guanosine(34) transglycosylase Tgt [Candidatus Aminicenantes bacterium]
MIFDVIKKDDEYPARLGIIKTSRGDIETPVFMPVGTAGAVKALTPKDLKELNAAIILGNTYHLFLRPGLEILKSFGSLHRFISWDRPMLTDSGGFQLYSLKGNTKINEKGVEFQSHIDGSRFFLSPEDVVDIQSVFDSDIQMALDYFAPYPAAKEQDRYALQITHHWAERARDRFLKINKNNAQFAIIQGGIHPDLREESLKTLCRIGFDGYAVGGLSIGETRNELQDIISFLLPLMPADKPRYLMGNGMPEEILFAVEKGIDMFDAVIPTRSARNGLLFTTRGKLTIKNERFKTDHEPPDNECTCYTCRNFSRAYLRHLYQAKEINAAILNSIHNVHFYLDFMSKIRYAIRYAKFKEFKTNFLSNYNKGV